MFSFLSKLFKRKENPVTGTQPSNQSRELTFENLKTLEALSDSVQRSIDAKKNNSAPKPSISAPPKPDKSSIDISLYQKQDSILTDREREFFMVLDKAATNLNLRVMTKVRLADLVKVDTYNHSKFYAHFNKICAKHIDFVVFTGNLDEIIAAVELDDSTHDRKDRQERDAFVDELLATTGIHLLRFRTYSNESVTYELKKLMPRLCPKCSASMLQRKNSKSNEVFWGCSQFPKCRHTESV